MTKTVLTNSLPPFKKYHLICVGHSTLFASLSTQIDDITTIHLFHKASLALSFLYDNIINSTKKKLHFAILCDSLILTNNNFLFIKSTRANSKYMNIPFIVIDSLNWKIKTKEAIRLGIDDVYKTNYIWRDIKIRIDFLSKYKKDLNTINFKSRRPESLPSTHIGKRIFDVALASSILLVFSPVLLIIALSIKLESGGPVIYRSKRIGQGYQVFDFLKFRSMNQDADAKLEKIAHLSQHNEDSNASFIKIKNDPRITRIGRIIRKTSLDEMPQLFNVLKGEMSIVGNRPLPLYEAELVTKDSWAGRFLAPAGITGLWQVAPGGKEHLTEEERIELDTIYAYEYSFYMDLIILSRTLPAMIQKGE